MEFGVRRVVTGHDGAGAAVVGADGAPPHMVEAPGGTGVADLWALAGPPQGPGDGHDPTGGFPLEPPPGGMSWRIVRLPLPDQSLPREQQFLHQAGDARFGSALPGMHATDTLDLAQILEGRIELEVEDGCVLLGPGDCIVQRGTQHRWRVVGHGPCTYTVAMFAVDPAVIATGGARHGADPASPASGFGVRRVVTGLDDRGRSVVVSDDAALGPPGTAPAELWTFGDAAGTGVVWTVTAITGDSPGHGTGTIDLVTVLEGSADLVLDGGTVALSAGDVAVQRGTPHRWQSRGDRAAVLVSIRIGTPMGGPRS